MTQIFRTPCEPAHTRISHHRATMAKIHLGGTDAKNLDWTGFRSHHCNAHSGPAACSRVRPTGRNAPRPQLRSENTIRRRSCATQMVFQSRRPTGGIQRLYRRKSESRRQAIRQDVVARFTMNDLVHIPTRLRQLLFSSPLFGEVVMGALRAPIPGEGAVEPIVRQVPPHPDRASAIRPLPNGER